MADGEGEGDRQDNLFKVIDGIVCQLDRTKKIFLILLVAITVIPPITFVANHLVGNDQPSGQGAGDRGRHEEGLAGAISFLLSPQDVPLWTSAVGIGIAIWQWFALSWWTRRYKRYKQKREEVERRLGEDLDKQ